MSLKHAGLPTPETLDTALAVIITNLDQSRPELGTVPPNFDYLRSHHSAKYQRVLSQLAADPELSAAEAAIQAADAEAAHCAFDYYESRLEPTPYLAQAHAQWRSDNDIDLNNTQAPRNRAEDLIGPDGDYIGYRNELAFDFYSFLTAPGETNVTVGPAKDGICKATGCGLHCDKIALGFDVLALARLHKTLEQYLALPAVQAKVEADPASYIVEINRLPVRAIDGGTTVQPGPIRDMRLTLSLVRDFMTWSASNRQHLTLAELPQFASPKET